MKEIKRLLPVIGITVFTLVISLVLYGKVMEREQTRCWRELSSTAQAIGREITTKLQDEIVKLHLVREIMLEEDICDADDIESLHLELLQTASIFSRVDILFSDNTLVSNGLERTTERWIDLTEIAERGEHITTRQIDAKTGKECVYYVLPVIKNDEALAVMVAMIEPESLAEAFAPIYYNGQINICLIDVRDGNYIMDTWHKELGNAYEMGGRETLRGYENVDIYEDFIHLQTGVTAFWSHTTGKPLYMYYTPVNMFDWQLLIFAQEEVLFGNLLELRKVFVFAGVVEAVLLMLYFAWNIRTVRLLEKGNAEISRQKEELKHISYWDMLTSMYNRNKYTVVMETFNGQKIQKAGTAYIDLNGLKKINDTQSHEAGDHYIQNAAKIISDIFVKRCYRIGGDEFVIFVSEMEQREFEEKITLIQKNMKSAHISIAIGFAWEEECESLPELLKVAEKRMYADKECYYQTHDRRR